MPDPTPEPSEKARELVEDALAWNRYDSDGRERRLLFYIARLESRVEELEGAARELGRGATRVTDLLASEPGDDRPTRYMGDRVIVHAGPFDRARTALTDTEPEEGRDE